MITQNGSGVIIDNVVVVWDGINHPKTKDDAGNPLERPKYSLGLAIHPQAPEVAEVNGLVDAAVKSDAKFKGKLPANAKVPFQTMIDGETLTEDFLQGCYKVNLNTVLTPKVYDLSGNLIDPAVLYAGCKVRVQTHAYTFNNVSKGVALSLDGVQVIDTTAPKLSIASGGGVIPDFASPIAGGAVPQQPAPMQPAPMRPAPQQPQQAAVPNYNGYANPTPQPGQPF